MQTPYVKGTDLRIKGTIETLEACYPRSLHVVRPSRRVSALRRVLSQRNSERLRGA
ncbi:hypothetical protein [Rhodovulum sp. BSW8]|uniref:hypothetical protein n=1 Tax=Rhodovulum sp. BSW8 TaxID=2259645 RepID=UPI001401F38E|nr:hypothetical protein [Rhodovulum sp. BSW8]